MVAPASVPGRPAPTIPAPLTDLPSFLERALALGEEGDWEGMALLLRDALEEGEDQAQVLCWLGVAERELGMEGVAYERFKQCLALDPDDPHVLATVGSALAHFDDPEAEAALRSAALRAPELPLTRWMYGAYLAREGMVEEALSHLDAAVELDPEAPTPVLERGIARALQGDAGRAIEDLGRAAALDPEDGWGRILLGLLEVEEGRLEEAAGDLAEGARLREDDIDAQILAALASAAVGWDAQAQEMLERARLHAQPGDLDEIVSAEERIDDAPGAARELLEDVIGPSSLRERLMARP